MISTVTARWDYSGDGANLNFAYTNRIDHKSWLKVYVGNTLQTLDTHYTVSGVGETAGGNVAFITAPPNGTNNVHILRVTPNTQVEQLPNEGPFPSQVVEKNIADKLEMQIQDLKAKFGTASAGKFTKWDDRAEDLTTASMGLFASFINQAVSEGAAFKDITFTTAPADTNYMVVVQTNWNTTWWIPNAQKLTSGFRVSFGTPPGPSATINVMVFT